jgi:hypothetical protein
MEKERFCLQCHCLFIPARNPQQKSCSRRSCQNARKCNWRRAKHKLDPDYRENRNHACKKWRGKNPNYWQQYRQSHPDYTDCNRDKQRRRKQMLGPKLLCGLKASQFANRDALIVEISFITNGLQTYHLIGKYEKIC